ncbi:MAG TPA: FtsX-like permease family protein [Pirellulales bacterium]|nr:FtsX-like permease family protein [Pirellulales bacterium]
MSFWRFIIESLGHRRRVHIAVALGVMTATAVLTGALVVGDSMRGSLRHLALDRLQGIDDALVAPRFFRAELADQIAADARKESKALAGSAMSVEPAILLQATLSHSSGSNDADRRVAGRATVLGVRPEFWKAFATSGPAVSKPLGDTEIVLNAPLAEKLSAKVGDEVILRLPRPSDIPADSALGRKKETVKSLPALRVVQILPADGLGRFGLYPSQQLPDDAFVALGTLQSGLDQPGRVDAIFASVNSGNSGNSGSNGSLAAGTRLLADSLHPTPADYGLSIKRTDEGYFNVTSDRMLIEGPIEQAAEKAFAPLHGQPTFTYLANYILAGNAGSEAKIPYSTITALDLRTAPPLGPFLNSSGETIQPLADDEIVLNRWAADDMAQQGVPLKPGDPVRIQYFLPDSLHGQTVETTTTLRLKAIVEMSGPAVDPNLVPELKGLTDRKSIADWNPPFRFDPSRVRTRPPNDQDERYWKRYRALPKAFVSLDCGRKLWASRFGQTTSWRIPAASGMTAASLADRLQIDPAAEGFRFLPVKQIAIDAASGTTPFDGLFLGFSFFIIASAVMLVALLFKLGIDGQGAEIGLLLALGFSRRKVRWILLSEGLIVSLVGGVVGVVGGVLYAWLMLVGLQTVWLAAVVTPFLHLYVTPLSLLEGFAIGVLVSLATIAWSLRQLRKVTVRRLIAGETNPPVEIVRSKGELPAPEEADGEDELSVSPREAAWWRGKFAPVARHYRRWRPTSWPRTLGWAGLALALLMALLAIVMQLSTREAQAETFFSSASLVLISEMLLIWDRLRTDRGSTLVSAGRGALMRLAVRNAARHPVRSTLTIGLMAAATFLIVSMSAFHLEPPAHGARFASGDGGFSLYAQTDLPIYQNLNTPDGRADLGFDEKADSLLAKCQIVSMRVHSGDDASCLNLFQPRQPRVLGVSQAMIDRGGFAWSASAARTAEEEKNPWLLLDPKGRTSPNRSRNALDSESDLGGRAPVVLDETTALYSLHLDGVGSTFDITAEDGQTVPLVVVGLLQNSLFQGDVLMSEAALLRYFPGTSGYRFFLIDTRDVSKAEARGALESGLDDFGFDAEPTADLLAAFMSVQNTYLSTFQSLGGLGLLLGTIGLAVVQLRSVFERRGELALLRAAGFRRRRLAAMVMWENAALLIGGLGAGVLAAVVAIAAQLFAGSAAIPWVELLATLVLVLVVGLAAGMIAVRATLRAPLIPALRGD